jgi:hypothetical protein
MDEDESRTHLAEPLHTQSSVERREREIIRTERSLLAWLGQAVKVADLMAILMVLATFFSAYATWRTALITTAVFAVADRPFLGVERVNFQTADPAHPLIMVNYKNFGNIPALDTIVSVHAVVDGKVVKPVADAMSELNAGIVSPNVPHYFYIALPADKYQAVTAGTSNLQVHVSVVYKGPAHVTELCYFERFSYELRFNIFQAAGGDDKCGSEVF